MKTFGLIPSIITADTPRFKAPKSMPLPKKYTYRPFLSPVTNQGSDPYCVPHSIGTWLNWKENIKTGIKVDNHINYYDIYKSKKIEGEGMTYTEAFDFLKKKGVKTDKVIMKIHDVGYIPNETLLKAAIIANGPCLGSLPVYDPDIQKFWARNGSSLQGLHAITIVGWNETGYIIRNSWGIGFGDKGYVTLPYSDAKYFRELWTILG